jgi:transcriptional regulator of acetoin/glycerol metabolism
MQYDWPGNIRELQNVIERAVVLAKEPYIRLADITISSAAPPPDTPEMEEVNSLKDLEYRALIKALDRAGGNISKAAKILGIGRDTIYRRLKKYNIGLKRQ